LPALGLLIAVVAGGFAYWGGYAEAAAHYQALLASFGPLEQPDAQYPLVAPLLGTTAPEATMFGAYTGLAAAINSQIETATSTGQASRVSVYFRNLNSGEWFGINQDDEYYPASLLKVPVMIAYYKEAETDPGILDETIQYQTAATDNPYLDPSALTPGKAYTVQQLINAMIIDSDNGATFTLIGNINEDVLDDVYDDLGIPNPDSDSADYQISTRTYAFFFRILYNATYLDPEYSQKALALLSQAAFTQGLAAGLPATTQVAHKFGEHVLTDASDNPTGVELSDCGVVYYPAHPYLLCVMTSTPSDTISESIIKEISATVYTAIDKQYATSTTP
jgi:beta-lactamase class A